MSRLVKIRAALAMAIAVCAACARGAAPQPPPIKVELPSPKPSGIPKNDTIYVTLFPAPGSDRTPAPAAIVLHPLGEKYPVVWDEYAKYLARNGISGAVVILPYHMQRQPKGRHAWRQYISTNAAKAVQAFGQAEADVLAVTDWLARQPNVDPTRLGVVGVSLGAIVAHAVMGMDSRLNAGVAILGGGDLLEIRRYSALFHLRGHPPRDEDLSPALREAVRSVDPLTYANRNRPRHVLMIQAARDIIIPRRDALELWNALGRPPIQWVDANHYAMEFAAPSIFRTTAANLRSVWFPDAPGSGRIPHVVAPTVTLGLVSGLDSLVTPALEWQAIRVGHYDKMNIAHLSLGLSGRGLYAGPGITINPYIDAGLGHRLDSRRWRFYLNLHIAF